MLTYPAGRSDVPAVRISVPTVDPRADLSALHGPDGSGLKVLLGQYVSLMKPRIIELLLITTIPVMFLAEQGVPDLWLVVVTVGGGPRSAGAANASTATSTATSTPSCTARVVGRSSPARS